MATTTAGGSADALGAIWTELDAAAGMAADGATSARRRAEAARAGAATKARFGAASLCLACLALACAPWIGTFVDRLSTPLPVTGTAVTVGGWLLGAALAAYPLSLLSAAWEEGPGPAENAAVAAALARRTGDEARRVKAAIQAVATTYGAWHADAEMARHLAASVTGVAKAARGAENRTRAVADSARRDERIKLTKDRAILSFGTRRYGARVTDVSVSGVGVEGNFPGLATGQAVRIGRHPAKVVRKTPKGFGLAFDRRLMPTDVHPGMTL